MENVLVIGANGQIGSELVPALKNTGKYNPIAADIRKNALLTEIQDGVEFVYLNAMNSEALNKIIVEKDITQIFHLAAMVSGVAEIKRVESWDLNVNGLLNVFEASLKYNIDKIYWPSSMAAYGPINETRMEEAMQSDPLFPMSIYGAAKVSGEQLCYYYANRKGVDVRSIRYPGLISTKTPGGGGTTDYAIDIFFDANKGVVFDCFLREDTRMEMLHMDDAVSGTLQLMETEKKLLTPGISYNLGGVDFTPREIYEAIKVHRPDFKITYNPDIENRQKNADSWPAKINDDKAKHDWGWKPKYDTIEVLTEMMLKNAYRTP